jgi:hypothetical protein
VATIHVPGTGIGPHGGKRTRRATIIAAVVLAFAAIVVPFGLHDIGRSGAQASAATTHTQAPAPVAPARQHPATDAGLGRHGDLPALLPGHTSLTDGIHVRLGDITSGVLRRTPDGTWRVLVRWNGRVQAVTTRGPLQLGGGRAAHTSTSWVSDEGLLYTRVGSGSAGRFRVYAWDPSGGTAYDPPTLVATDLGWVCFNRAFTAFGNCRTAG